MLDSGTTTLQIARLIKKGPKRKIMVTTNAINIAMELAEAEDIPVVLIGGEVRHRILCCTGNFADEWCAVIFDRSMYSYVRLSIDRCTSYVRLSIDPMYSYVRLSHRSMSASYV